MTTSPDKPDRISSQESIVQGRPTPSQAPLAGEFESLMQESENMQKGVTAAPQGLSPAQVQPTPPGQPAPSLDSVLSQVGTAQDSFTSLQNKLNTKNLQLTNSQRQLLRSKLSNSTTHLRAVNEKLGVQAPATPTTTGQGPLGRLFGYLSDGEMQLNTAQAQLNKMKANGDTMKPADFMLIQIKLNQAQQELDYSSILLSKVVSGLTQLLNTQL